LGLVFDFWRFRQLIMVCPVYIGIAGWSYQDWKGIVYPNSNIDQLEYVAGFVDVIEINNTFYRPPAARFCRSWLARTAGYPDFFFTAKLHRDFTHQGKIDPVMVRAFHDGFEPMLEVGKLRQLLIQFRYDFDNSRSHRQFLTRLVAEFNAAFNIVVEVRHKSWQQPKGLMFLEELGLTVCNLDYPLASKSFNLPHCTIGKCGYFRLHGRNVEKWFSKAGRDEVYNYCYDKTELGEIKQRIDKLSEVLQSLTVIANNHYRGGELANAIELKAALTGGKQPVPEGLLRTYPRLAKIALKENLF